MKRKNIIFIVGPTAVGKSKLAINLAKKINAEIVSCDSMQVYKGLDILSCKPSKAEQRKVKHHLIGIVNPSQNFDVNKFVSLSEKLIGEIHKRDRIPVFVGGTGLYADCLLSGIFQGPKKDAGIRKKLYEKADRYGNSYLYKRLQSADRESAKRIHSHDLRRIIRALEVYEIAKKPLSVLQKQRKGILQDKRFDICLVGLDMSRAELYERINKRVEAMFKKGAVSQAKKVLSRRCSKTFKQALGVKEIEAYLKGQSSLEQAKQLLKRNTRRYAKRQMTWFRRNSQIRWLKNKTALAEITRIMEKW